MANWQPNWENVDFDHAAAWEAEAACRQAASELDNTGSTFTGARRKLVDEAEWEGNARDEFDTEASDVPSEITGTRDALLRLAGQLSDASTAAATEQTRREADRERWREERDAELAREGLVPSQGAF